MIRNRVIPVLLINNKGSLVKTSKFSNPVYIGDPINAVKIFNEKEVDEVILLDINATKEKRSPFFDYIKEFAGECFMPACYGGGVKTMKDIENIVNAGIEKVALNSALHNNDILVKEAVSKFGSSTIVASVDVTKDFFGKYKVYINGGKTNTGKDPVSYTKQLESLGVGEIFLNSMNKDGLMNGYDLDLISNISGQIRIPLIACGGAGTILDFKLAVKSGASAVAAGSMFVFHGKHKAVLINYPNSNELECIIDE